MPTTDSAILYNARFDAFSSTGGVARATVSDASSTRQHRDAEELRKGADGY